MSIGALGLGYLLVRGAKETVKDAKGVATRVANAVKNTEVTSGDRAGYTFAPGVKAIIDLAKGESPKDIGKKLVKTHTENVNDVLNGPIPKWAVLFGGSAGVAVNTLAD